MALKLGTLEVDINGDTTGLKQAENVVEKSSKRINSNLKNVDRAANDTTKKLGGIGRRAGMAGIQVQQFVGQLQGGQNAMLALSQQGADLGFVLGAPLVGAMVGIGATIAGVLLPSLFSSKDATEELEDAMKRLDDVAVETGDGVEVLSKKLIELAKKSQQAAKAEIQSGIVTAMNAIKTAATEADDVLTDVFGRNLTSTGANALFLRETIVKVSESLGITSEETGGLIGALRSFRKEASVQNLENLQKKLDGLAVKYGETSPEVVRLAETIRNLSMQSLSAQERIDFLRKATTDLDTAIEETEKTTRGQVDSVEKYIKALEAQVGALALTGTALFEYEAGLIGAEGKEKQHIVALKEAIAAYEEKQKAIKDEAKARAEAEKFLEKNMMAGKSPEEQIKARFEKEREELRNHLQANQDMKAEFAQLERNLEEQKNAELLALDERRQQEQAALNQQALSNLSSFHSTVTDLIQAAGKEGTAAAKAAFLAGKAIQVAQIIASTEVAAAQAGAVAAIGGPVSWLASTQGIRTIGYANAALVAGLAAGQAFEQGGIVGGHSTTGDRVPARVNSGEMILTTRQQQKLFNMANGREGGGNSSPNVNIINNGAPIAVESMAVTKEEITLMINNRVKASQQEINQSLATGRGDTFQALQKGTRVERRL